MSKVLDKILVFNVPVTDMDKARAFYVDQLGMKVTQEVGQGKMHWVTLNLPGGETSLALTTAYGDAKPGTMMLQFSTSDIQAAHKQLKATGPIMNDFHGPGSGVKGFQITDPDGDVLSIVQLK